MTFVMDYYLNQSFSSPSFQLQESILGSIWRAQVTNNNP